jgi:hypothetical protein
VTRWWWWRLRAGFSTNDLMLLVVDVVEGCC